MGGGITGLSAAIEAAEAGCEVLLVERQPAVGGRVAQMHQYFPKLCPPVCGLEINLRRLRSHPRIQCLTLAEVQDVDGRPGDYRVRIQQRPRFVTEQCTACGACAEVCPVERPNTFDFGLGTRRAVHGVHGTAWPPLYVVDAEACLGPSCSKCVPACPQHAIDLTMPPRELDLHFDAVIWATGWDPYEVAHLDDLGFSAHPDVITNMMMERMACPSGPTGGKIRRPSNGDPPTSVAFVQCAGSRDEAHLRYCSSLCCLASAKQVRYVRAQHPRAEMYVFYIDLRAFGRYEVFLAETQRDEKVHFVAGKVAKVTVEDGRPVVLAEDTAAGKLVRQPVDLVVLAAGMVPAGRLPSAGGASRPGAPGLHGFVPSTWGPEPADLGLLAAGCAREPMDVAACVRDATSATLKALQFTRPGVARPGAGGAGGPHG